MGKYKDYSHITVYEFIEELKKLNEEIYCDGKTFGSHKFKSHVRFVDEDHNSYELDEIDVDTLAGCGCWDGICFRLRKEKDED